MTDQTMPWWKNRTIKGLTPWVALFAALLLLHKTFDYRIVNKGRDLAGLEDNTLYLNQITPQLCTNQAVYAKLGKRRFLVPIGAVAGQSVFEQEGKLHLGDSVVDLGEAWKQKAQSEISDSGVSTVPQGHVLILNTGFQEGHETKGWGIAVVPETAVGRSLSHVLFSRDLSRIGQPAKELGTCVTRASEQSETS